jgi:hypothetical protein
LFSSWSAETRGYTQLVAGRSLATLGVGYRVRDVNETAGQTSLDLDGYFTGLDLSHRIRRSMASVGYEYAVSNYDALQSANRDPTVPPTGSPPNPPLTQVQNAVRARLDVSPGTQTTLGLEARQRWVVDTFEGDLTYRQTDATPYAVLRLPMALVWTVSVGYRSRAYSVRDTYERFLVTDTTLRKNWTPRWAAIFQAQFLRKSSNVPGDEFRERLLLVGVSATL